MQNYNSPQIQQPENRKSKKWVFIIIGGIILIFLLLIVIVIIGIAVYFMIQTSEPRFRPHEAPANINQNRNTNSGEFNQNSKSDPSSVKTSNDKLLNAIRSNPKVGRFTLQNVSPTTRGKIYGRSLGEVKAIYASGNDNVTFVLSEYKAEGTAVSDFGQMFDKAKREKAMILAPLRFGKGTIGVTFSIENITMRAYCDWPAKKEVLCNLISSANADAITEFNNALKN